VYKPVVNVTVSSSGRFKPSGGFLLSVSPQATPIHGFYTKVLREQKYLK